MPFHSEFSRDDASGSPKDGGMFGDDPEYRIVGP